jgi:hypothetical protein
MRDVFSFAELNEIFTRSDDLGPLGNGKDGRALGREGGGNLVIQSLDDGHDSDNSSHTDHDSDEGKRRPQLVCSKAAQGDKERLPERCETKKGKNFLK